MEDKTNKMSANHDAATGTNAMHKYSNSSTSSSSGHPGVSIPLLGNSFSRIPVASPKDVKKYREEAGSDRKGVQRFLKDHFWSCVVPVVLTVGGGLFIIWWKSRCHKNEKIATQDNASTNKIKEQNNATSNKKEEIVTQSDADIRKIQASSEAKLAEIQMREKLRKERTMLSNNMDHNHNDETETLSYAEVKAGRRQACIGQRYLVPWMKIGFTRGFAGPTNVGKTTFLLQEAALIAGGKCERLTADWNLIRPVHVLYFSLEQTYEELEQYYAPMIDPVREYLHIICGQTSPQAIVKTVRKYLPLANEYGLVCYIDNAGKLEGYAQHKEVVWMQRELEQIRQSAVNTGHPLTPVYVYHTSSTYDPSKPFTPECVRGNKDSVNLNNDFTFLTYTSYGENYRILGQLKNKHGQHGVVTILKFAEKEVDQFEYVGCAKEVDVLCSKEKDSDVSNPAVVFDPHKAGRKPTITYEQALQLQAMVTRWEKKWKDIMTETGHKKSKIKECIRQHKQKDGIK